MSTLDLLATEKVRGMPLAAHTRPRDEVGRVLADFRSPGRGKTVITIP